MEKILKILLISSVAFSLFSGPNEDLLAAAENGDPAGVEAAITAGADINHTNDYGSTVLFYAARSGLTDIVQLLLDRGMDINQTNSGGFTLIMVAAGTGHIDIVRLLLDKGANVNATTEDTGNTALIYAASNGHRDIVRLLLKMGANIYAADIIGNTALTYAQERSHTEIVKILEETLEIKQLVDNAIQGDSSSYQELVEKIKDLNIDSYEFNLIFNNLIQKISTKNSDVEMPNIIKMLITLAKKMAIEFARYFGFGIASKISHIELPQELVIEYLLSQFLKERLSPINLQIKIPMAYGGSENFLQLVAHEYGELERQVIKVREKRESKIVNWCEKKMEKKWINFSKYC